MMKCKCGEEMKYTWCYDEDYEGICFNLYVCENCGFIFKSDVCGRLFLGIDVEDQLWTYNKSKKEWTLRSWV